MASFFRNLSAAYTQAYQRRPMLTLSLTNGALASISDGVAQAIEANGARKKGEAWAYDGARTLRFAAFGTAMGPLIGKWLQLLDSRFPLSLAMSRGRQAAQLGKRVLADQVVAAPVGLALFTGIISALEGKNLGEVQDKFASMYGEALVTNWQVWPAIQAVNFTVVPLQFRLGFQQTCGILWTCYLSMLNHRADEVVTTLHGTHIPSASPPSDDDRYKFEEPGNDMKVIQDEGPTKD